MSEVADKFKFAKERLATTMIIDHTDSSEAMVYNMRFMDCAAGFEAGYANGYARALEKVKALLEHGIGNGPMQYTYAEFIKEIDQLKGAV